MTKDYKNKGVNYCFECSWQDGAVLLESPKDSKGHYFLSSPTLLVGDIDIYRPEKKPEHCVPNLECGVDLIRLMASHWAIRIETWKTPNGLRFIADTQTLTEGKRRMIMNVTACDPIYRIMCRKRRYYSSRLTPKENSSFAAELIEKLNEGLPCSKEYQTYVDLHSHYVREMGLPFPFPEKLDKHSVEGFIDLVERWLNTNPKYSERRETSLIKVLQDIEEGWYTTYSNQGRIYELLGKLARREIF